MTRLCYESVNYAPFVWDGDPNLLGQIAGAARAGFPLIGLDLASVERFVEEGERLETLAEALRAEGMQCFEVQALVITDDEASTLAQAEQLARIASTLRVPYVQAGVSTTLGPPIAANLRRAAEIIRGAGASVALEFLPFTPLRDIAGTRELIRQAETPDAGVMVDTWHFFYGPDDWSDLEALPLEEIAYVQFNDHPGRLSDDWMYETTQRRVLPGEGEFDLERFCAVMRAKGYDRPVSVEIISEALRALPPAEFAARVYAATAPYWS
jgi:sugar phosphate isomerase/epimerase